MSADQGERNRFQTDWATAVMRNLVIHTEAASRLQAAEKIEDTEARRQALAPLVEEMRLQAYALGNTVAMARQVGIDDQQLQDQLLNATCQLAVSLNTAGSAAALLARSDEQLDEFPPSAVVINQEEVDSLFTPQVREWLVANSTGEATRTLQALRASLSLSEF